MNISNIKTNLFNKLGSTPSVQEPPVEGALEPIFESIGDQLPTPSSLFGASTGVALAATIRAGQLGRAALEIPSPVKQVAKISAKSGASGALVDAAIGALNTLEPLSKGQIDMKQAGIHVVSEGVCGFLTGGAGAAGSVAAYMLTGSLGPIVLASGMASSMAVRWGYRQVVGETLPEANEKKSFKQEATNSSKEQKNSPSTDSCDDSPFDNIGE